MDTDIAYYPDLAGKVAFVTGGASGIGAAIVAALAGQHCRTAFVDIDSAAAERLCSQLDQRLGQAPLFLPCDIRDLDQLAHAIELARERLGPVEVLVNNAAHDERHSVEAVSPAYWDDRLAVNLRHYFFAAQAVLPQMQQRGGGSIINFSSTSWKIKTGNYPLYAMCKAAAHGLTRSMARDAGRHRIRINTVTPGWVMTERQLAHHLDAEGEAAIEQNQCLPGKVMPSDLAAMVLFLASDASRMCTAQEFVVDAGWT
jgi:NAD(P)-dependent dehydrogenase (short-subunit alcohol dehydrogenase family)